MIKKLKTVLMIAAIGAVGISAVAYYIHPKRGYKDWSVDPQIQDKPLTCRTNRYNCPGSPFKNNTVVLNDCDEVKLVWDTCETDEHLLDGHFAGEDSDGAPCEKQCGN